MNNIFDEIPDDISDEIFETLVDTDSVTIERIISKGNSSPDTGWYDQGQNEWVIVLQGGAVLSFDDGSSVNLNAGSYLKIPAHQKHKVSCTDPDVATIWLAVHY